MADDETLLRTLTVETLRIYKHMLKRNPNEVTLDELSNTFNLKKPTILHHLEKLKRIDLAESTQNGYKVKEKVTIDIIKGYTTRLRKIVATWVPILTLFILFLVTSLLMLDTMESKMAGVFLSLAGIALSVKEIKKVL